MKKINLILIFLLLLTSCGGLKDAGKVLRNEKITNTDEFLVKKKQPLIIPPDINNIPEPRSMEKTIRMEKKKLKIFLKFLDQQAIIIIRTLQLKIQL